MSYLILLDYTRLGYCIAHQLVHKCGANLTHRFEFSSVVHALKGAETSTGPRGNEVPNMAELTRLGLTANLSVRMCPNPSTTSFLIAGQNSLLWNFCSSRFKTYGSHALFSLPPPSFPTTPVLNQSDESRTAFLFHHVYIPFLPPLRYPSSQPHIP